MADYWIDECAEQRSPFNGGFRSVLLNEKQALERSVFMFAYDCLRLFLKLNELG